MVVPWKWIEDLTFKNFLGVTKKKKYTRQEGRPYQADHRRSPAHGSDYRGFLCHPTIEVMVKLLRVLGPAFPGPRFRE